MRAYSNDLRERVIAEIQGGSTVQDSAEKFQVSKSWAYKIWRRFQTTGSYEALPIPGGPRKIEGEDLKRLKKLVKDNPDATLQELIDKGRFKISVSGLHRILRREKITYKKNVISKRSREARSETCKTDMESHMLKMGQ